MENKNGNIKVKSVSIENNILNVDYDVTENLAEFFNLENKFKVEYGENIEDVPKSIAIIPFVSNVLRIIWLTDSKLEIEELDENYFNSIENTRRAFQSIYPNAKFEGKVEVKKLVNNINKQTEENNSVFLSGGIDSV